MAIRRRERRLKDLLETSSRLNENEENANGATARRGSAQNINKENIKLKLIAMWKIPKLLTYIGSDLEDILRSRL